jgi:hypothetical protein
MKHDELIGQVQARAKLSSVATPSARSAPLWKPSVNAFGMGWPRTSRGQVPVEIGEHLRRTEAIYDLGTGERFDRDEFIARAAGRSGTERRRPPTSPAWFLYL